jgi:hypothetical protein
VVELCTRLPRVSRLSYLRIIVLSNDNSNDGGRMVPVNFETQGHFGFWIRPSRGPLMGDQPN